MSYSRELSDPRNGAEKRILGAFQNSGKDGAAIGERFVFKVLPVRFRSDHPSPATRRPVGVFSNPSAVLRVGLREMAMRALTSLYENLGTTATLQRL